MLTRDAKEVQGSARASISKDDKVLILSGSHICRLCASIEMVASMKYLEDHLESPLGRNIAEDACFRWCTRYANAVSYRVEHYCIVFIVISVKAKTRYDSLPCQPVQVHAHNDRSHNNHIADPNTLALSRNGKEG